MTSRTILSVLLIIVNKEVMASRNEIEPYQFEPVLENLETEETQSDDSGEDTDYLDECLDRLISTDSWCVCGNCSVMPTAKECTCCMEINNVRSRALDNCILNNPDFNLVCLNREVLRTAMIARADIRCDDLNAPILNESLRHQAYRQFTYWVHSRLGYHIRRVIPACVVMKIRVTFPSPDDRYVGYREVQL